MERSPLVLQGQAGWGDSALGPSPLLRGWELWELGWFPAQLKGQERPVSYKAWEAVPVFFQIPLMMGNVSLKTPVIQRGETFPQAKGGWHVCSEPRPSGAGVGWGSSHSTAKKAMTGTRRPTCSLSWWPFTELSRPQFPHLENRLWHLSV